MTYPVPLRDQGTWAPRLIAPVVIEKLSSCALKLVLWSWGVSGRA
jgi:hypothetical protein